MRHEEKGDSGSVTLHGVFSPHSIITSQYLTSKTDTMTYRHENRQCTEFTFPLFMLHLKKWLQGTSV